MVVIIYLDIVAIMPRGEFTGVHEQFFYYFPPPARIDPSSISTSVRLTHSREKPVTKALLHPPDDRSDALISVHVPLKSCRDLTWAPRSWRSSPSGYETKGLGHP